MVKASGSRPKSLVPHTPFHGQRLVLLFEELRLSCALVQLRVDAPVQWWYAS